MGDRACRKGFVWFCWFCFSFGRERSVFLDCLGGDVKSGFCIECVQQFIKIYGSGML